jgi:hypothetical protein
VGLDTIRLLGFRKSQGAWSREHGAGDTIFPSAYFMVKSFQNIGVILVNPTPISVMDQAAFSSCELQSLSEGQEPQRQQDGREKGPKASRVMERLCRSRARASSRGSGLQWPGPSHGPEELFLQALHVDGHAPERTL